MTPKRFFHNKLILLLLSLNALLVLLIAILVLIRLDSSHTGGYIVQYRSNLGLSAFSRGGVIDLLSFVAFAVVIFGLHLFLSLKVYQIRHQLSLVIQGMGLILLVLTLIVSNALLILR